MICLETVYFKKSCFNQKSSLYYNLAYLQGDDNANLALSNVENLGMESETMCHSSNTRLIEYFNQKISADLFLFSSIPIRHFWMHKSSGKNSNQDDFSHGRVNFFHYALDKIKNKDNLLLTLGVTYLYGLGDQKIDYKKSFNYMMQASNAGSKTAMGYLAKMYISKLPGIEYDIEKALSYAQTLMKAVILKFLKKYYLNIIKV